MDTDGTKPEGQDQPPPTPGAGTKKFKDVLDSNLVWFALGMIITGAIGAFGAMKFVEARVETELQSAEIQQLLRQQFPVNTLQRGAVLLYSEKCPEAFDDLTDTFNGRYIVVDRNTTTNVQIYAGDGSHTHAGGQHEHAVTGSTGPIGGGERSGNKEQLHAAHMSRTAEVTGTALKEKSGHDHAGGVHDHQRAGFRLCKVR